MELRHLRYFIKAAELLHFTRAAEALYISQPTLSVHIQQMEEELATELFARVGRHVQLTEAGKVLLARARQAVSALESAEAEINAINGLLRGSLAIACLPLHGSRLLPGWISSFNTAHPNVHIRAQSGSSEDIQAAIVSGSVDLGFSTLSVVDHPEIKTKALFNDDIVMVMAKTHRLARKKNLVLSDLVDLPMALISSKVSSARAIHKYFDSQGISAQIVVEYDDGNALVEIVKMGELVTLLPIEAVREEPAIQLLRLPAPGIQITFGALWTYLGPVSKAFLETASLESEVLQQKHQAWSDKVTK